MVEDNKRSGKEHREKSDRRDNPDSNYSGPERRKNEDRVLIEEKASHALYGSSM